MYLIYFHDRDMKPEIHETKEAAEARFKRLAQSWTVELFERIGSTRPDCLNCRHRLSRDCGYAGCCEEPYCGHIDAPTDDALWNIPSGWDLPSGTAPAWCPLLRGAM